MIFSPNIKIIANNKQTSDISNTSNISNTLNILKNFKCAKEICNMSHFTCITNFNTTNDDLVLIVEDGVSNDLFRNNMSIYKIIDNAPKDWDIILLSIDTTISKYNAILNYPSDYIYYSDIYSSTIQAYIINKKGANKIVTLFSEKEYNNVSEFCDQCTTFIYKYPLFAYNNDDNNNKELHKYILSKIDTYKPFFSIILPVYNGMNYIENAINSVLAQTFKDFELIIVNDGSIDNTETYLNTLNNKQIYVLHQKNQKTANAINNGIKRSSGSYITWTSHDNLLHHDFLLEYHNILKYNNYIHFIYGGTMFFGTDNWNSNPGLLNPRDLFFAYPGIASFMWSRDTICKVGDFNANLHGIEDLDYIWRTIEYNSKIYSLKKMLYMFRMHNEQATYEFSMNNKWVDLNKKMLTLFIERNLDNFQISSFYPYINKCKNINRAYSIGHYELAMKIINDNRIVYRETLLPFALMCLRKSHEYDNTFNEPLNLLNVLTNNKNFLGKKFTMVDINNEELFSVEKEHMKSHEFS